MNIPGYTIERELGHGGMSTVYLAEQQSLHRKVALKVMAPALAADRSFGERFLREARTVAQLTHPNILAVYDIGSTGHSYYLAMEYVPCGDLKQVIRRGALVPEKALAILKQIASALGYAHRKGFVHRDVKPENILFREDGTAVLSDFGIAKAVGSGSKMTGTGMTIGTAHYMSPEQAGGTSVDGRADLYSLGVVLYEMLVGQVPFDGDNTVNIALQHLQSPLPQLPAHLAGYQPLLDMLMAKRPDQRFADAQDLISVLEKGNWAGPAGAACTAPTQILSAMPDAQGTAGDAGRLHGRQSGGKTFGLWAFIGGAGVAAVLALFLFMQSGRHQDSRSWESPSSVENIQPEQGRTSSPDEEKEQIRNRMIRLLSAGEEALREEDKDRAVARFGEALALSPDDARARQGLEMAQQLNKAGEVIRDRLQDGSNGPEMVVIPAGSFLMGDVSGAGYRNERPVHRVTIEKPVGMGRFEITFDDYDHFCHAVGRPLVSDEGWGRGRQPVINVSWHDAVAYAAWLSEQTGHHYRLPTEAEWEYGARAGNAGSYWWGDAIGQGRANCAECGSQWDNLNPAPVGSFTANAFGLFDTVGNVWEWCQDPGHAGYVGAPDDGAVWEEGGEPRRILRGGAWNDVARNVRSSIRGRCESEKPANGVGFRLVREL
ncbi:MAG: SUMF1/EgtB/PvdO family nonheme iron enzyme [Syntrophotaleaceae bacterium]